jgi:HNH endonuclease
MGAAVAGLEMAAGDLVGAVLRSVLAEVLSTPWLVGLLVLLAIGKLVQLGRAVVHGGHGRDPRRTFSRAEKVALLERAGHRCEHHSWLLGRCRETEALQADHVHPHSRGGATDVANGQALCRRHNRGKAARVPWGWELARMQRRRRAYFPPGPVTAVVRHGPRVRSTGERQSAGAGSGTRALRNVPADANWTTGGGITSVPSRHGNDPANR